MQLLVYILVLPFLYVISILPFRLFYLFSDFIYLIVYHIIGYRKKVVTNNLKLVFPEKSSQEIKTIRRQFYSHMCDIFLEMIKTLTISKNEMEKRYAFKNYEYLEHLESLDKNIIVMLGHYASYEWSIILQYYIKYDGYGVYKKIKNKYFDKLMRGIRSKHNLNLISSKEATFKVKELYEKENRFLLGLIADQSPKLSSKNVWLDFMGIKVPTFVGAESMAKKHDCVMVFLKVNKVKRGYYEAELIPLAENPNEFANFEITKKFNAILSQQIKDDPRYYLWTHKRWKYKGQEPINIT